MSVGVGVPLRSLFTGVVVAVDAEVGFIAA